MPDVYGPNLPSNSNMFMAAGNYLNDAAQPLLDLIGDGLGLARNWAAVQDNRDRLETQNDIDRILANARANQTLVNAQNSANINKLITYGAFGIAGIAALMIVLKLVK